jgi:hypothetical protein
MIKVYGPLSFTSLAGFDGTGASQITPVAKSVFLVRVDIAASYVDTVSGVPEPAHDPIVISYHALASDLATHGVQVDFFDPVDRVIIDPDTNPSNAVLRIPEWVGYINDIHIRAKTLSAYSLSFSTTLEEKQVPGVYSDITLSTFSHTNGTRVRTVTPSVTVTPLCQFKTGW